MKKIWILILAIIGFGLLLFGVYKLIKDFLYNQRIDTILKDDKEIERKWLVDKGSIPYNLNSDDVKVYDIKQTYISFNPEMRVRDYNDGTSYEFTIKMNMTSDGMVRDEVNFDINKDVLGIE